MNVGVQISYFLKSRFDSNDLYYMYNSFLLLRPIVIGALTFYYAIIILKKNINMSNPNRVADSKGTVTFI